ncbi:unnamed protein product [Arctogadus glacialis]
MTYRVRVSCQSSAQRACYEPSEDRRRTHGSFVSFLVSYRVSSCPTGCPRVLQGVLVSYRVSSCPTGCPRVQQGSGAGGPMRRHVEGHTCPRGSGAGGPMRRHVEGHTCPRGSGAGGPMRRHVEGHTCPRGWAIPSRTRIEDHLVT